jgi:hypothetical protein
MDCPFFLAPPAMNAFLPLFKFCKSGDGGFTTTCEFGLTDESAVPASASDSGGEIKRAVCRGLAVDGSWFFLRIGCGLLTGVLDSVEDEVVIGLLWWLRVVALAAPGS